VARVSRRIEVLEAPRLDLRFPADKPLPQDLDMVLPPHRTDAELVIAINQSKGCKVLPHTIIGRRPLQAFHGQASLSPALFGNEKREHGKNRKVFQGEQLSMFGNPFPLPDVEFQAVPTQHFEDMDHRVSRRSLPVQPLLSRRWAGIKGLLPRAAALAIAPSPAVMVTRACAGMM
jgi:hypothetical protein